VDLFAQKSTESAIDLHATRLWSLGTPSLPFIMYGVQLAQYVDGKQFFSKYSFEVLGLVTYLLLANLL
jgi:hypothetical protein